MEGGMVVKEEKNEEMGGRRRYVRRKWRMGGR